MGVLAKLLGTHGANVSATLGAVYLAGRTALPAKWLAGISVYRAGAVTAELTKKKSKNEDENDEILLGGAETVAQLRFTPAAVAQSAFFEEWSALVTILLVVLANVAVDSAKAVFFSSSTSASSSASLWAGTFYSSLWAILTALYTLVKVEVDQARVLSSWAQLRESAVVGVAGSGVALLLMLSKVSDSSSSSSSSSVLPSLDLVAGGKAAARVLYVATEIEVETIPRFLVALPLAAVAGALAPLLAGAAARSARAVSLSATRTPRWGREMLFARSSVDRCALRCAALVAPLAAALLWVEPCARLWASSSGREGEEGGGSGGSGASVAVAVDFLRSLSLLFAAFSSVAAARPSVAAHCGTALVVWWTRKHGFVSRKGKKGGRGGGGGDGGEIAETEAARRRRAGEVLRLSMQFINLFALKAGVQALAPGVLWLGWGMISLEGGGSKISLWLGGWSAAVFVVAALWHLVLYWCGWLTDVPTGGKR